MDFIWKEEYNIGIKEIDSQHQDIFNILAELNDAIAENKEKEIIDGILESLLEYSESHFDYEESLLEEKNYPKLEHHKKMHEAFEQRINRLIDAFEHGKNLQEHLAEFLEHWLIKHIDSEDKKFVLFLKERGFIL